VPPCFRGASDLYRESACEEFGEIAVGVKGLAVTFVEDEATGIDRDVCSSVCSCVSSRTALRCWVRLSISPISSINALMTGFGSGDDKLRAGRTGGADISPTHSTDCTATSMAISSMSSPSMSNIKTLPICVPTAISILELSIVCSPVIRSSCMSEVLDLRPCISAVIESEVAGPATC
jgi:hypothetical protein